MSTSSTGEPLTASRANKEFNEFARIQGLEPAILRWLRESFQVFTVADLANLSVNRVLSQAADAGKSISREQIERWVLQAQTFVAEQTPWQTFATFVVSLQSRQIGGQVEQRTTAYFLETDRRKIWAGAECNGVYELMLDQLKQVFQLEPEHTVTSDSNSENQSAAIAAPPSELDLTTQVMELMADLEPLDEPDEPESQAAAAVEPKLSEATQSATPSPPEAKAAVESAPASAGQSDETGEPLTLEIIQLTIWQPPEPAELNAESEPQGTEAENVREKSEKAIVVDRQKRSLPRRLQAEAPFDVEVTFQLSGSGAIDLTKQPISYHTEVYGQNRTTIQKSCLNQAAVGQLVAGKLTYTCRLANLVLPNPDTYRLQVMTRLAGGHARPDLLELPFVQVI